MDFNMKLRNIGRCDCKFGNFAKNCSDFELTKQISKTTGPVVCYLNALKNITQFRLLFQFRVLFAFMPAHLWAAQPVVAKLNFCKPLFLFFKSALEDLQFNLQAS